MIRNVTKFFWDKKEYDRPPSIAFNVIDTETKALMEGIIKDGKYYTFHNGQESDRYLRVIDLRFVDICETDLEDDLSVYGFKLMGQHCYGSSILKRWVKC